MVAALVEAEAPAQPGCRVLVVEDSPDHRELMTRVLERAGITVQAAGTGEEALPQLRQVDLVLIDQRLPAMSGTELMELIGAMDDGPGVLLVSGDGSRDLIVEALRGGAIDYIAKDPGFLDRLPAAVERAYRQHDLTRQTRELQRLALLIHEPTVRQDAVQEIVTAAARLLRADAGLLALAQDRQWVPQASYGDAVALADHLPEPSAGAPATQQIAAGILRVGLAREGAEPPGVMLLARRRNPTYLAGELALVRTFAAFASSALRNIGRHELEQALIDELQHTIRARHDFLASVSHELRTPLTAIVGYTQTMLLGRHVLSGQVDDRELLQRVERNAQELRRLIDQLLDAAALERGVPLATTIESVELDTVVGDVLDDLSPRLGMRPVHLDGVEQTVLADPQLLYRVLSNLITNAAKYSPPDTAIGIRARLDLHGRPPTVRVEIRDEGVGLDEVDARRIFEPFWRAGHAVAEAVRGVGLGLALVREYVDAMQGEVGVDSTPGSHSTFWFTLPPGHPRLDHQR